MSAEGHLAAIVDSSSDAIVSKDLDGIVQSWNRAAERIFGWPAEEMIGASIRRIIPEDRQDEEDRIIARVRAGEIVPKFETVRLRKDGDGAWIPYTYCGSDDVEFDNWDGKFDDISGTAHVETRFTATLVDEGGHRPGVVVVDDGDRCADARVAAQRRHRFDTPVDRAPVHDVDGQVAVDAHAYVVAQKTSNVCGKGDAGRRCAG